MSQKIALVHLVVCIAMCCGCDEAGGPPAAPTRERTSPPPIPPAVTKSATEKKASSPSKTEAPKTPPQEPVAKPPAEASTPAPAQPANNDAVKKESPKTETAEPGSQKTLDEFGRKKIDGDPIMAPITVPIEVYLGIKWRVSAITVQNAINNYKGLDPKGKGPATQEEFMREVIEKNGINLPPLPAGHRYVYDPKQEALLVEKPTR